MNVYRLTLLFLLHLFGKAQGARNNKGDNRVVAYLGNWQNCPSADQLAQYTHIVIAFAVSYTWEEAKNICSTTCEISDTPVCNNSPNSDLIDSFHEAGKKVILSFGGAGMGGSWDGDVNDCWEYCFGRESQVVSRLVEIVNSMELDGVDIDYEYFYTDDQNGSGFKKGAAAIKFISDVTTGLRKSLPAGATVSHAPMDADLVESTDYYKLLKSISSSIDFIMPQFYNGITRPAVDGFSKSGAGSTAASVLYASIVTNFFGGDATRIVFGFCISDCSGTGSNANGDQAAAVMKEVGKAYSCNGGVFFWVVQDDNSASWSTTVNAAIKGKRGCSAGPTPPVAPQKPSPVARPPVKPPTAPAPAPTPPSSSGFCCPSGYTGYRPYADCNKYYQCVAGQLNGAQYSCPSTLAFDETIQNCNWPQNVKCKVDMCGQTAPAPARAPVRAPVRNPAPSPVKKPVKAPVKSPVKKPVKTPVKTPVKAPTAPSQCCPKNYTGFRSWASCKKFYQCVAGKLNGAVYDCPTGLLFDEKLQNCNWPEGIKCKVDTCQN